MPEVFGAPYGNVVTRVVVGTHLPYMEYDIHVGIKARSPSPRLFVPHLLSGVHPDISVTVIALTYPHLAALARLFARGITSLTFSGPRRVPDTETYAIKRKGRRRRSQRKKNGPEEQEDAEASETWSRNNTESVWKNR